MLLAAKLAGPAGLLAEMLPLEPLHQEAQLLAAKPAGLVDKISLRLVHLEVMAATAVSSWVTPVPRQVTTQLQSTVGICPIGRAS